MTTRPVREVASSFFRGGLTGLRLGLPSRWVHAKNGYVREFEIQIYALVAPTLRLLRLMSTTDIHTSASRQLPASRATFTLSYAIHQYPPAHVSSQQLDENWSGGSHRAWITWQVRVLTVDVLWAAQAVWPRPLVGQEVSTGRRAVILCTWSVALLGLACSVGAGPTVIILTTGRYFDF